MSPGRAPRSRRAVPGAFLVLALALACASAPLPAGSRPRVDAEQALVRARSAATERAWSSAARSFGRAANAFAAIDDAPAEASARRDEAEALRRAGDPVAATAAGRRALELDRRLDRPEDAARDRSGLARSAAARGDLAAAIGEAEEARAGVASGTSLAVVLDEDLALYLLLRGEAGDPARAVDLLTRAREASEALGDARGVATSELQLGRAALAQGDPDAAAAHLDRALDGFRRLEDPEGLAHTHELLSRLHLARGEVAAAQFELEQARAGFTYLDDRAGLARLERVAPPGGPAK